MTPDGQEYNESAAIKPGDAVVTYDCEGVKIGCSICYDLRFPALFQALADKGAEMIALPAAFTLQTGRDHWAPCFFGLFAGVLPAGAGPAVPTPNPRRAP